MCGERAQRTKNDHYRKYNYRRFGKNCERASHAIR